MTTNMIASYSEEKHRDKEKRQEEGRHQFMNISLLTGELYATTRGLLMELSETESTEISTLRKEYDKVIVKVNLHELQYIAIIQNLMGKESAQRFEGGIIEPLREFHKLIDRALISGRKPDLQSAHWEDLVAIKREIIEFNSEFLESVGLKTKADDK